MSSSCQISNSDPHKDFFFPDLEEVNNNRVPPEEVRILELEAVPYPDAKRVRINLSMTPYLVRPHLDLVVLDPSGAETATASIIEPMTWKQEFTIHLRTAWQAGKYKLLIRLFYPPTDEEDPKLFRLDIPVDSTDEKKLEFEIPEARK